MCGRDRKLTLQFFKGYGQIGDVRLLGAYGFVDLESPRVCLMNTWPGQSTDE